ncbi:MAG: 3-dehydroquinate synthase [Phycisphaerae bacterium]|nr:3-dehydroquinate synthase [Phycisphaerae bacterium]
MMASKATGYWRMRELEFHFQGGDSRVLIPNQKGRSIGPAVSNLSGIDRCLILTDSGVPHRFVDEVMDSLRNASLRPRKYVVPAGDDHKTLITATRAYNWFTSVRANRRTALLTLGGGMVGDLGGFVAATWMRGLTWINVPTTVLAMIDSCLGGKVGLNRPGGKNLIGLFYHPTLIWADPAYLQTLSDAAFAAGLAESVKHAVALDAEFLAWHEQNASDLMSRRPGVLLELIERNLRLKGGVVLADEREAIQSDGPGRAVLNFGHTIGHALEAASGFRWPHGVCVALGMIVEMELAVRLGTFDESLRRRIESLMTRLTLPRNAPEPFSMRDVLTLMKFDKKNRRARPRFVLPQADGRMGWYEAQQRDLVVEALKRIEPAEG